MTAPNQQPVGRRRWAIAEGYLPGWSHGPKPQMESHETLCFLNANDSDAQVQLTVFFEQRHPIGPYPLRVPSRRTLHFRLNQLEHPEKIPVDTDFAVLVESDIPIVVQHTRLDSRQSENALMTTIAYAD